MRKVLNIHQTDNFDDLYLVTYKNSCLLYSKSNLSDKIQKGKFWINLHGLIILVGKMLIGMFVLITLLTANKNFASQLDNKIGMT